MVRLTCALYNVVLVAPSGTTLRTSCRTSSPTTWRRSTVWRPSSATCRSSGKTSGTRWRCPTPTRSRSVAPRTATGEGLIGTRSPIMQTCVRFSRAYRKELIHCTRVNYLSALSHELLDFPGVIFSIFQRFQLLQLAKYYVQWGFKQLDQRSD